MENKLNVTDSHNIQGPGITLNMILDRPECLPGRGSQEAAGYDLKFNSREPRVIPPGEMVAFETGVKIEMLPGMEAQVRPRSGLMFNQRIVGMLGTIDSDFRGEIKVLLWNASNKPFTVNPLDRVGQLVFSAHLSPTLNLVDSFTRDTSRGENGFGHTGLKG
jgi:dUTP pyrophosphatase